MRGFDLGIIGYIKKGNIDGKWDCELVEKGRELNFGELFSSIGGEFFCGINRWKKLKTPRGLITPVNEYEKGNEMLKTRRI